MMVAIVQEIDGLGVARQLLFWAFCLRRLRHINILHAVAQVARILLRRHYLVAIGETQIFRSVQNESLTAHG
jgi:hypothetical protein